ncbi:methyltransferase domain-containing protein [Micromonospora sp. DT68]|uniref:methyltransferase domain-containing protein n=1 Tax=Micromonospora sp. DT68 TaxID=3416522 RepID=UPI003CF66CDB
MQHLADPHGAIAEIIRVVRPGGRVVLADPDYDTQPVVSRTLSRSSLPPPPWGGDHDTTE